MKRIYNLFLTLVVMLTMAQMAWATEPVTKTISFSTATRSSDQMSIIATDPDDYTNKSVITANGSTDDIGIVSSLKISNKTSAYSAGTEVSLFISPYVNGRVTKIEFTSVLRKARVNNGTFSMSIDGMKYNGIEDVLTGNVNNNESITFISNSDEGIAGNLIMKLGVDAVFWINKSDCEMIITYIPSTDQPHSHDFVFNAVGNTLTATCGHSDGLDCSLADANYEATLTLSAPIDTYYRPNTTYSAKHNLSAFNILTGLNATATDITYVNKNSGDVLGTTAPMTLGNYTASVTVTVGGTDYTLTTDFKVNSENGIINNVSQFSVSKTSAENGEDITITFTPRLHELVNTLTVTGATTNMSIGNGITKVDEYTYTFMMSNEEVTIDATFKSSDTSLYKYAITTDFTGSGEVDFYAEEYLGAGDVITITFMPYLQGNLEAGSVVLEGLTVTGVTTSMTIDNGITDNGDNTYTFMMPDEDVTVTGTAWLSADAILTGTIDEPINIKQGNGIQIGYENKSTYVNDGALPLVIPDGNTLRLVGGTDINLDRADKNAIVCEGDATIELVANSANHRVGVRDDSNRNSGKAIIKVSPAGKTLTIRVADESTESVNFKVESRGNVYGRSCDVIGCDEGGTCGSIIVESGEVESWLWFNDNGKAIRTTDGTITFGYKFPDDCIILYGNGDDGCSGGTVKIEEGKQYHSDSNINLKYTGTLNLQGKNYFGAVADKYTVTFDENGGSDVDDQTVAHGMKATEPTTTREGYTLNGWKNGDDAYDFNSVVTSNLTLSAEWTENVLLELFDASSNVMAIADAAATGKTYNPVILKGRTLFKDDAWNTLCLPFNVTLAGSPLDGATARTLTAASIEGTTLNLTFGDPVDELVAGTPYIIKWADGTDLTETDLVFSGVTINSDMHPYDTNVVNMDEDSENDVTTEERIRFIGTYAPQTFTEKNSSILILGGGNTLYYPQPDTTDPDNPVYPFIGAQRAYFKIGEDDTPHQVRMLTAFNFNFGDGQTGITTTDFSDNTDKAGAWYDLSGRRLSSKPTKSGVYVNGGRKIVIK